MFEIGYEAEIQMLDLVHLQVQEVEELVNTVLLVKMTKITVEIKNEQEKFQQKLTLKLQMSIPRRPRKSSFSRFQLNEL